MQRRTIIIIIIIIGHDVVVAGSRVFASLSCFSTGDDVRRPVALPARVAVSARAVAGLMTPGHAGRAADHGAPSRSAAAAVDHRRAARGGDRLVAVTSPLLVFRFELLPPPSATCRGSVFLFSSFRFFSRFRFSFSLISPSSWSSPLLRKAAFDQPWTGRGAILSDWTDSIVTTDLNLPPGPRRW